MYEIQRDEFSRTDGDQRRRVWNLSRASEDDREAAPYECHAPIAVIPANKRTRV